MPSLITARQMDLVLLPAITWLEASCMLVASGVSPEIAPWVLAYPERGAVPTAQPTRAPRCRIPT